jgi:hypothetical protein
MLANAVDRAFRDLLALDTVTRVVFVYLNQGDACGLGRDAERLEVRHFADWAKTATIVRKPLLFVVGAYTSTLFVEEIWAELSHPPRILEEIQQFVGFLTSGDRICWTSASAVSPDLTLVDVFDPNATQTPNELLAGHGIIPSMFARQFLSLWVYNADALGDTTLSQFPDLLNAWSEPYRFGFHAALQMHGTPFANFRLQSFFPFKSIKGNQPVRGHPDLMFGTVIPPPPMGRLLDDIGRFWDGAGAEDNFPYRFVYVERLDGVITEIETGELDHTTDRAKSRIHAHVEAKCGSADPAEGGTAGGGRREVKHVPLNDVWRAFRRIAKEEGVRWTVGGLTTPAWRETTTYLTDMFGPLPDYMSDFVSRLAEAKCDVSDVEKYMMVLERACLEVKHQLEPPVPVTADES